MRHTREKSFSGPANSARMDREPGRIVQVPALAPARLWACEFVATSPSSTCAVSPVSPRCTATRKRFPSSPASVLSCVTSRPSTVCGLRSGSVTGPCSSAPTALRWRPRSSRSASAPSDAVDLPIRAGFSGGDVILFEGDDYIGGPVNLASRLCDVAAPGEILAAADMAEFVSDGADLRPVEPRLVPGFMQPVPIVASGRRPADHGHARDHRQLSFSDPAQPGGSLHRHGVRHPEFRARRICRMAPALPSGSAERVHARDVARAARDRRGAASTTPSCGRSSSSARAARSRAASTRRSSPATPSTATRWRRIAMPRVAMTIPPSTRSCRPRTRTRGSRRRRTRRSPPCAATRSVPGSSSRWRATSACSPRERRPVCSSSSTASSPTSAAPNGSRGSSARRRPRSSSSLRARSTPRRRSASG